MAADAPNQPPAQESTKISFRFCRECSNLLYPREQEDTQSLLYACATCPYTEDAESSCVYRNELGNTVGETAGITQDVGSDPTLPRANKTCPSCNEKQAVFFQSQQRTAETGMRLYYVCCSCGNVWQ